MTLFFIIFTSESMAGMPEKEALILSQERIDGFFNEKMDEYNIIFQD